MAPFYSYKDHLIYWLEELKPNQILEWGPGYSTTLMLKHSEAVINSVENNHFWSERARDAFKAEPRVHLYFISDLEEYVNAPADWGLNDIIFIDGVERVSCLLKAIDYLSEGGVVILHDSERHEYDEGREPYQLIYEAECTAVMKPLE